MKGAFTMDLNEAKGIIEKAATTAKNDPDFAARFAKEPVKTLEELTGFDLPDDQINPIIEGIKSKIAGGSLAEGVMGKLGGLFGGSK